MSFEQIITVLALLVSVISVIAGLYFNSKNKDKVDSDEVSKKATEMATINVKLDNIDKNVNDIKTDINSTKKDVQALTERVVAVEQSAKQAHHRLDGLEDNK